LGALAGRRVLDVSAGAFHSLAAVERGFHSLAAAVHSGRSQRPFTATVHSDRSQRIECVERLLVGLRRRQRPWAWARRR
jgi:hypothetical protein